MVVNKRRRMLILTLVGPPVVKVTWRVRVVGAQLSLSKQSVLTLSPTAKAQCQGRNSSSTVLTH
jgi:hypothetical protein